MTKEEKQKALNALKISAPVIAVTQEEFNDYIQTLNQVMDWLVTLDEVYSHVKAIPSAEPYKGMTNGEVIKAIFPHGKKEPKGWTMRFYIDEYCYDFSIDWWNSPYKGEQECIQK